MTIAPPKTMIAATVAAGVLSTAGAGVADRITQKVFDELDAPIRRVTTKDAPIPYNRNLEASMLPTPERVVAQVHEVLYR